MMNNRPQHSGHFGAAIRMPAASAVPDAEPVYRAGDTVMHPSEGVCTIADLRRMALSGMLERTYYVLKPATQKGSATVYMPVARGNTVLRPLLSEQDIRALIRRSDRALDCGQQAAQGGVRPHPVRGQLRQNHPDDRRNPRAERQTRARGQEALRRGRGHSR